MEHSQNTGKFYRPVLTGKETLIWRLKKAQREAEAMGFDLAAHLIGVALLDIQEK